MISTFLRVRELRESVTSAESPFSTVELDSEASGTAALRSGARSTLFFPLNELSGMTYGCCTVTMLLLSPSSLVNSSADEKIDSESGVAGKLAFEGVSDAKTMPQRSLHHARSRHSQS